MNLYKCNIYTGKNTFFSTAVVIRQTLKMKTIFLFAISFEYVTNIPHKIVRQPTKCPVSKQCSFLIDVDSVFFGMQVPKSSSGIFLQLLEQQSSFSKHWKNLFSLKKLLFHLIANFLLVIIIVLIVVLFP